MMLLFEFAQPFFFSPAHACAGTRMLEIEENRSLFLLEVSTRNMQGPAYKLG